MMLSMLFSVLNGRSVKMLSHIPVAEVLFFSSLGPLVAIIITLWYRRISMWGQRRSLLLYRSMIGNLSIVLYFVTLQQQHISLPSAITLHNTAPIFAALLGIFMVQEPVRLQQWFFFVLSFAGVILINGFSLTSASWYVFIGLGSAFCKGLANNIIRKTEHKERTLVMTFYSYLVSVLLSCTYLLYDFVILQGQDLLMLGAISVLGYTAHYCAIKAYQLGPVTPVSATAYIAIIYAFLLNYLSCLFLGDALPQLRLLELLGAGLVLLGIFLNIFIGKKAGLAKHCKVEYHGRTQ